MTAEEDGPRLGQEATARVEGVTTQKDIAKKPTRQAKGPFDPRLLIDALHPPGLLFAICVFGRVNKVCFRRDPAKAVKVARRLDDERCFDGVYFLVANLAKKPVRGRGTEADVVEARAAWTDVDALDFSPLLERVDALVGRGLSRKEAKTRAWSDAPSEVRKAAMERALAAIRGGVADPASAFVNSGRGWHAYWLFNEPVARGDLPLLKGVNRAIAERVGGDHAIDLARVLRMPGTNNRKDPDNPIPCRLAHFVENRRYDFHAFASGLGATAEPLKSPGRKGSAKARTSRSTPHVGGAAEAPVALALPQAWERLLAVDRRVRATWEGRRRDLGDQSRSGYGMALAAQAAGVTQDPAEILAILAAAP
ncbi:MAG TPA: hypothetical protein VHF22_07060, partial [Planctomycetota bacterium]|nr:hypothetical protein [Planctomycetota bacterium]